MSNNGNNKNTIFILTRKDVELMVRQHYPNLDAEQLAKNPDFLHDVKKGVEWGLECWSDVMKVAIEEALPNYNRQRSLNLLERG